MKPGKLRLLMCGAILVVLLNAWLASAALRGLFYAQAWYAHTLDTITATEEIQVAMSSANSAARAYLLTGNADYQRNYEKSITDAHAGVDKLQKLTDDNASQQERITVLRRRISVRVGAIDAALAMRRTSPGELNSFVLGPALSETPDGGISPKYALIQMRNEEERLRAERDDEARSARRRAAYSFSGASLLDLLLVVFAFRLLEGAARDRVKLQERSDVIDGLNRELTSVNEGLERRVEQRTRELAAINQELEAFSYSVSHDLRAPLRTIDGFSLALKEDFSDCLNEEGQDYINRVRSGVQRMGSLIDALLQLSRVTRSEVQRERIDLSAIVRAVFDELTAQTPERSVELSAQPGVLAMADARLVRIAFENLVGNALKYSSRTEHAQVEFGSDSREGRTVYFIRDNGVGFDMQYVDRLFTAFQRLHGDREFKGSGIGLATVSRIIRRHHGEIWAEGEVGKGATFYFTLES